MMNRHVLFPLLALLLFATAGFSQEGWSLIESPVDVDLRDVDFMPSDTAYAVGANGVILRGFDNGSSWIEEEYEGPGSNLLACDMQNSDANAFTAVGETGAVISYPWYDLDSGFNANFLGVLTVSFDFMLVVGENEDGQPVFGTIDNYILDHLEELGEGAWEGVATSIIRDFNSTNLLVTISHADGTGRIIRSEDYGSTWSTVAISDHGLNSVAMFSNNAFRVAVGDYGTVLISEDNGVHWSEVDTPVEEDLLDVAFSYSHTHQHVIHAVGTNGTILFSSNSGATWYLQVSNTDSDLHGVACQSGIGLIVGDDGVILRTTNTGLLPDTDPPGAFDIASPAVGSTQPRDSVCFSWNTAVDPEGYPVWYNLVVEYNEETLASRYVRYDTSYVMDFYDFDILPAEACSLNWSVYAHDTAHETLVNGAPNHFFIEANAEPPTDFSLLSPLDGIEVNREWTRFTWETSTDPEHADVYYEITISIGEGLLTVSDTTYRNSFSYNFWAVTSLPHEPVLGYWSVAAYDPHHSTSASNDPQPFVLNEWNDVEEETPSLASSFEIADVWPNPFNHEVRIRYSLPEASQVRLNIVDILGRNVKTLVDQPSSAGQHEVLWSGDNLNHTRVSSGTYLVHLDAATSNGNHYHSIQKLILVK